MAKATTKAPKTRKKAAKAVKAVAKASTKIAKKAKQAKKAKNKTADTLWKLTDHPLVGELIAIGATAAVAAIAQQSLGKKKNGSNKAVKEAGRAAAAAIGARLISQFAEEKFETKSKTSKG